MAGYTTAAVGAQALKESIVNLSFATRADGTHSTCEIVEWPEIVKVAIG
jgi:hypothetical protein